MLVDHLKKCLRSDYVWIKRLSLMGIRTRDFVVVMTSERPKSQFLPIPKFRQFRYLPKGYRYRYRKRLHTDTETDTKTDTKR
jgi:hypothetical protein